MNTIGLQCFSDDVLDIHKENIELDKKEIELSNKMLLLKQQYNNAKLIALNKCIDGTIDMETYYHNITFYEDVYDDKIAELSKDILSMQNKKNNITQRLVDIKQKLGCFYD